MRKYKFITCDLVGAILGDDWVNYHIERMTTYGVLVVIDGVKHFIIDVFYDKVTSGDFKKIEEFVKENEEILRINKAIR